MTARLRCEGLRKAWHGRGALACVSLGLSAGEIVGVLGANGAGKTTLLHCLTGLVRPDAGAILLDGEDVTAEPVHRRCARGLGFLPQDSRSFEELTVADNLRGLIAYQRLDRAGRERRLQEVLDRSGLGALAARTWGTLSGGEQRLVEIAKTLVRQPRWLLLDEPFAALDPMATAAISALLRRLQGLGVAVLIADHRFEAVLALAPRVVMLHHGAVVAEGDAATVRSDAVARAAYFGAEARP
ncbi:MAG: ATP-binding cassette domain-containing protein [Planctomycetes bacterium]|nr:ATP-binding cassette domain-containing protein [Planctomycetota bacterium]